MGDPMRLEFTCVGLFVRLAKYERSVEYSFMSSVGVQLGFGTETLVSVPSIDKIDHTRNYL